MFAMEALEQEPSSLPSNEASRFSSDLYTSLWHFVSDANKMVSVFSGEVTRTWRFPDSDGKGHEVVLYHHPLTGARAAMSVFQYKAKACGGGESSSSSDDDVSDGEFERELERQRRAEAEAKEKKGSKKKKSPAKTKAPTRKKQR